MGSSGLVHQYAFYCSFNFWTKAGLSFSLFNMERIGKTLLNGYLNYYNKTPQSLTTVYHLERGYTDLSEAGSSDFEGYCKDF